MDFTSSISARPTSRASSASSTRRGRPSPELAAIALVLALALGSTLAPAAESRESSPAPYVLITTDGHRIDVMEKPAAEGERLLLHLYPRGDLASYSVKGIDWPATEKFNAPPPPPAPAPSRSPAAGTPVLPAPGRGRSATRDGGVLSLKLVGGGHARVTTSPESAAPGGAAPAPAAGPAAKAAESKDTASLLASLAKELADLRQVQSGYAANRVKLQEEMAALEAKAANTPPAGLNIYESPTRKAINDLQARIQAIDDQLSPIDRRILEIRAKQSELGSASD